MNGKALVALWAGFVVYALTLQLVGPSGLPSMSRARAERDRMEASLEALKRLNADLAADFLALGTSSGRRALVARDLGYLRDGEVMVRIPALPPPPPQARSAGAILRYRREAGGGTALPAALALAAGVVAFLLLLLGSERREGGAQGIRRRGGGRTGAGEVPPR